MKRGTLLVLVVLVYLQGCQDDRIEQVEKCALERWTWALQIHQVPYRPFWEQCYDEIIGGE